MNEKYKIRTLYIIKTIKYKNKLYKFKNKRGFIMYKKQRKIKSFVISLACLSTLSTAIPYNVLAINEQAKENVSVSVSDSIVTTISVKGKKSVDHYKNIERKNRKFSDLNPTGIYVEPNTPIEVENKGKNQVKAMIGTYSYEDNIAPIKYVVNPGKNTLISPTGGMLYIINEHEGITIDTSISGGKKVPFFKLGETTISEWQKMLEQYKNSYAVELLGKNSLITVTYAKAKEYLSNTNPEELLQKHDEVIDLQAELSGLSPDEKDPNYVHFVEDRYDTTYMKAGEYRTAYAPSAIKYVLNKEKLVKEGWGPWHEVGHLRQQIPWRWDGMNEVTVNIYSLYVQTKFGNESRLNDKYSAISSHINSNSSTKNFDSISDVFVKLGMFWQLHLSLGEDFYPKLHEYYRDLPQSSIPTTNQDKKQFFVKSASKIANRDLSTFFDKWGFEMTEQTRQEIAQYPELKSSIWESTDNDPVIEDREAPTAPTNIKASNITSNSIDLEFNSSTDNIGVKEYKVWDVKNQKIVATTTSSPITIGNLESDTDYEFAVYAYDASGNQSEISNSIELKTEPLKDTEAPSAPSNLKVSDVKSNSIKVDFTASTDNVGVVGYKIWDANTNKFIATTNTNSTVLEGLKADTEFMLMVLAVDEAGNYSDSSNIVIAKTKPEAVLPDIPAWDSTKAYSIVKTKVMYNGDIYENKYYINPNSSPSARDHHGEITGWRMVAGPSLEKPFEWNAQTVYKNEEGKADRVVYNGKTYEAKYWSKGDTPSPSNSWGPWSIID